MKRRSVMLALMSALATLLMVACAPAPVSAPKGPRYAAVVKQFEHRLRVDVSHLCPSDDESCIPGSPAVGVPVRLSPADGDTTLGLTLADGVLAIDLMYLVASREELHDRGVYVDGRRVGEMSLQLLRAWYDEQKRRLDAFTRQRREAKEADDKAVVDGELASGRCTQQRHSWLQIDLQRLKEYIGRRFDKRYVLADYRIEVLQSKPLEYTLPVEGGSEVHVFAVGFDPLDLEVLDAQGQPIATPSHPVDGAASYGRMQHRFQHRLQHPPVTVQPEADTSYSVTVRGQGCAMLALFRTW